LSNFVIYNPVANTGFDVLNYKITKLLNGVGDLMATADKKSLFVHGQNGGQVVTTGNAVTDLERAQDVARRYRCEFTMSYSRSFLLN
jgi:hypothetical protein